MARLVKTIQQRRSVIILRAPVTRNSIVRVEDERWIRAFGR